ncbi:hypothetical protein ACF07Q_28600 [Nocardiopsis dassonvillei]|uniref:hypothetical protein n=1 Tax=Nocardiopsis dassonvillei TaxID=2014 RepID=UPI0037017E86
MPDHPSRRYRVIGPKPIRGVPKGGEVTLAIDPGAARTLVTAGHLEPLDESPPPTAPAPEPETPRRTRAGRSSSTTPAAVVAEESE